MSQVASAAGTSATAGAGGDPLSVAGAGASSGGPAFGNAGTTGSLSTPATAAGTFGMATGALPPISEQRSGGCQVASVGAGPSRALGLLGTLLLAVSARSRRRQRPGRTGSTANVGGRGSAPDRLALDPLECAEGTRRCASRMKRGARSIAS